MTVSINGKLHELNSGTRIDALLALLGLADKRLAVELNGELLPRSKHANTALGNGDVVEIVRAVGGG